MGEFSDDAFAGCHGDFWSKGDGSGMEQSEAKSRILIAIPARGGSKRLFRKNLADLHGKAMMSHTISAAIDAGLCDDVFVCTEDEEIASVAKRDGAKVFQIPESMAGDLVSSTVPCLELYDSLKRDGKEIDYIITLQPTSPLRTGEDIKSSFDVMQASRSDYLVSVTPIDPHYFHWAFTEKNGAWGMFFGKEFMKERLLLPPILRPNGAIKIAKTDKLKETENFLFHDYPIAVYVMPEERSIHVATTFDLVCARAVFKASSVHGRPAEAEK